MNIQDQGFRSYLASNVLFTSEVAEQLQVSRQRVNDLVKNGALIPFKKTNQGNLFLFHDIENYKNGNMLAHNVTSPKIFDQTHNTYQSVEFFKNNKIQFGPVKSIFIYFDQVDAAHDNFFLPSTFYGHLQSVEVPHMILRNFNDDEMWIRNCNCGYGGTGPNGAVDILIQCGFKNRSELEAEIFNNRVVKFVRDNVDQDFESFSRDSYFDKVRLDPYTGAASLHMFNGNLVLLQQEGFRNGSLTTLDRFRSFLPHPIEMLVLTRQQALELGYFKNSLEFRERVFQVIIKDASGRQIWLSPIIDDNRPISKQEELRILLEKCGFDVPEHGLTNQLKIWLESLLRKGTPTDKPIILTKRNNADF